MSTRRSTRQSAKEPDVKSDDSDSDDDGSIKEDGDDDISSDFDTSKQSKRKSLKRLVESDGEGSSSDSSVGDYLKKADEIDLNSTFFTTEIVPNASHFIADKKKILKNVQRLSDSDDSESEGEKPEVHNDSVESMQCETKINFSQLRDYNKKIEETKACVAKYEKTKKKKMQKEKGQDINKLLSLGEKNEPVLEESILSDFDDSEEDPDWQEITENVDNLPDKITIPKDGVQITLEMPNTVKKKTKGFDMMAAIKRRINRIKKENQIYVHKVHLLCWIAHGNYINSVLNSENLLAQALSLLPSDNCYPPKHADMSYLEQIVKWYGKMMKLQETAQDFNIALSDTLSTQISKKIANSKNNFIYIFIIILRSLGLQCRLVISFQCLPLRPANSELCSLSTKDTKETDVKDSKNKDKKVSNKPSTSTNKTGTKRTDVKLDKNKDKKINSTSTNKSTTKDTNIKDAKNKDKKVNKESSNSSTSTSKANSKKESTNKLSKTKSSTLRVPQLDGADDDEFSKTKSNTLRIPQLDGADDDEPSTSKRNKPNLKIKLKENLNDSTSSTDFLKPHYQFKSGENTRKRHLSADLPDPDFKPKKPSPDKSPRDINENKKIESKSPDKDQEKRRNRRSVTSATKKSVDSKEINLKSKLENNLTSTQKSVKTKNEVVNVKRTAQKRNSKEIVSSTSANESSTDNKKEEQKRSRRSDDSTKSTTENKRLNLKPDIKNKEPVVKRTAPKRSATSNTKIEARSKISASTGRRSNVMNDIVSLVKGQMRVKREEEKSKMVRRPGKKPESDIDSDYFPDEDIDQPSTSQRKYDSADDFKYKVNNDVKVKRRVRPRSELESKVFSDDEEADKKKKKGIDLWVEVFLEEEEKWISVDLIKGQVHCVSELYSRASQPVNYIVAWNNNLSLKDITARYCTNWNTVTRKLRADPVWWNEALLPFQGIKTPRDKEEDEDLAKQQLDKPLPSVIGEYKNHPLYALKRHLLKFEAIYPPNAMTLGFIRKEAVYARECVHTLHSREIWVKHAKVVKPKQQPYKIVKARPKYDRLTGNMITDLPLEIFGSWQVEDYVPPTAENGVVPRNAYGNVELFKACMLPKKTVHLQLPGLNKVAKKLSIDCAPAVVGFDFHSGWSHPTFDGFVVCEEFKDTLIAAWQEDREESSRKEQEKYDKRVWGNWRKLIKAVLIRERLKARYDFGKEGDNEDRDKDSASGGKKKAKGPSFVAKKRRV